MNFSKNCFFRYLGKLQEHLKVKSIWGHFDKSDLHIEFGIIHLLLPKYFLSSNKHVNQVWSWWLNKRLNSVDLESELKSDVSLNLMTWLLFWFGIC